MVVRVPCFSPSKNKDEFGADFFLEKKKSVLLFPGGSSRESKIRKVTKNPKSMLNINLYTLFSSSLHFSTHIIWKQ